MMTWLFTILLSLAVPDEVKLIKSAIVMLNPQASKTGHDWEHEHERYYTDEMVLRYAVAIAATSAKYDQDWRYLTAIVQD